MQLTDSDQKRVLEWLSEKCGALRCFCCGMSSWVTGGAYLSVGYNLRTTKVHYHEGIPYVSLVCPNCGYIMQFSTAVMGIGPDTEPTQPAELAQPVEPEEDRRVLPGGNAPAAG